MNETLLYMLPGVMAFLSAIWLFVGPHHNRVQAILGITLLLFAISQIAAAQFFNPAMHDNQLLAPLYFISIVLVPPSFCLFISALTYPKMNFKHSWLFFSASLVYILIYVILLALMTPEDYAFYSRCLLGGEPFTEFPSTVTRWMSHFGLNVFRLMMPTLMLLTAYASIVRINKFHALLEDYISRASEEIRSPRYLVYHVSLGFIPLWCILTAWPPYKANVPLMGAVLVLISIIVIFVGIYGSRIVFTARELKKMSVAPEKPEEVIPETTGPGGVAVPQEIARLNDATSKLLKAVNEDKVYLDPNLTIVSLAYSLGVNRLYLNKMLTFLFDMSFNSYIKHLRIEYAKEELAKMDPEEARKADTEQLCEHFGYGFCAVFIKDFQEATGMTPLQWVDAHHISHS